MKKIACISKLKLIGALCALLPSCADNDALEPSLANCGAIVGGGPDVAHTAVGALLDAFGNQYCSGTLVGLAGDESWLLTAAHCLDSPIDRASFADDLAQPLTELGFGVPIVHPNFDSRTGEFDFALLPLAGQPADVAPIRIASEGDALAVGAAIEFVGFGETERPGSERKRNSVAGNVLSLSETTFGYDQADGGPCSGDSGGPALILGDEPILVGVTSYGEGDCWTAGVSGRVSAAADFLVAHLNVSPDPCAARGR